MNGRDGLFVGMAQALALIPGVSRSGATISAGLFRDFDRVAAARYSFLLSVPAVVLSGLFGSSLSARSTRVRWPSMEFIHENCSGPRDGAHHCPVRGILAGHPVADDAADRDLALEGSDRASAKMHNGPHRSSGITREWTSGKSDWPASTGKQPPSNSSATLAYRICQTCPFSFSICRASASALGRPPTSLLSGAMCLRQVAHSCSFPGERRTSTKPRLHSGFAQKRIMGGSDPEQCAATGSPDAALTASPSRSRRSAPPTENGDARHSIT